MLTDPAALEQALELSRRGDKLGVSALLQGGDKTAGEFMTTTSQLDALRTSASQQFMTASVREQTRTTAGSLSERVGNLEGGSLTQALGSIGAVMQQGQTAAGHAFDQVLSNLGRGVRNPDGSYSLGQGESAEQYATRDALLQAVRDDTTPLGDAARFTLGGGGAMTAAGNYLGGYLPGVQEQLEFQLSKGDFMAAKNTLGAAYSALVQMLNHLLAESGSPVQLSENVADARAEGFRLTVASEGMTEGGKAVVAGFSPLLNTLGVGGYQSVQDSEAEYRTQQIERRFAASPPIYKSERSMLEFEQGKLAQTNQSLLDSGAVKIAGGELSGSAKMVQVYNQNLKRLTAITEEQSLLMVKQWREMISDMMDSTKTAITEAASVLVSEFLTGSPYRKKVEELDKNYGNKVQNAGNSLELYETRKVEAGEKLKSAASQYGTGSRQYLEAKQEYEFYSQKILEMKDNVRALNTEWAQQKFELKTIGEMLVDIFDNLANQIINKTIGRLVDFGLDTLFGAAGRDGNRQPGAVWPGHARRGGRECAQGRGRWERSRCGCNAHPQHRQLHPAGAGAHRQHWGAGHSGPDPRRSRRRDGCVCHLGAVGQSAARRRHGRGPDGSGWRRGGHGRSRRLALGLRSRRTRGAEQPRRLGRPGRRRSHRHDRQRLQRPRRALTP